MEVNNLGKRKLAIELRKQGLTSEEIKRDYGFNISFTNRWWGRHLRGESLQDRPRSGRPKKLSKPNVAKVKALLKRKVGGSVRKARTNLQASTGVSVSHETVWRTGRRANLKFRIRVKKPALKPQHKAKRVKFARTQRPAGYWRKVFFTDEKTFGTLYEQRGEWLEVNDKPQPRRSVKYGISVRVWGGVGYRGTTPLYRIPKSMTSVEYQKFLETQVYPDLKEKYGHDWIFQQDGDGSHSATLVKNWLYAQPQGWVSDFPSLSPEPTIIENFWALVGQRLVGTKVTTADGLWKRLKHEWDNMPISICRKLADSVPHRLELILAAGGGPIKY